MSFLHLTADARRSTTGAVVRLVPSTRGLHATADRLNSQTGTLLVFSQGGRFDGRAVRYPIGHGDRIDVFAIWINDPDPLPAVVADEHAYVAARRVTSRAWLTQLERGTTFIVPEPRAVNAERALLVQELAMTWRYSVGNTYEELSFAEALNVAEVMAGYGYNDIAKEILRFALRRLPQRFSNRRAGERLTGGATYYLLSHDRAYVREETPELAAAIARLGRQIERPGGSGLLNREAVSTDIGTKIYGLHAQTAVWQGLMEMGHVWGLNGYHGLASRCHTLAARLGTALRKAVLASERWLPDGSLFIPLALLDHGRPFNRVTATRDGTYWNLLIPYALASGFFPPHGEQARGILRYLLTHGARLLGLVRSADYKLYGNASHTSGTDQVYGLNVSRFLADNDQPDQLVLSLYGMLAAGMTPNTYIAGEGATVAPLRGSYDRTMLLPPNSAANAAFLETLRLMLVHETRNRGDVPNGLELAYSTSRGWLQPGKTIVVSGASTSFGPVSYSIRRIGLRIQATVSAPAAPALHLRLRLPPGLRIATVNLASKPTSFDRETGTINLSGRHGRFKLTVALTRH